MYWAVYIMHYVYGNEESKNQFLKLSCDWSRRSHICLLYWLHNKLCVLDDRARKFGPRKSARIGQIVSSHRIDYIEVIVLSSRKKWKCASISSLRKIHRIKTKRKLRFIWWYSASSAAYFDLRKSARFGLIRAENHRFFCATLRDNKFLSCFASL